MESSQIIGHIVLLLVMGSASYGINVLGKNANWPFALVIIAPIVGVYFLGWWALLTAVIGFLSGSFASANQKFNDR